MLSVEAVQDKDIVLEVLPVTIRLVGVEGASVSGVVVPHIKSTYSGLFVDEYQDCTKKQHEIIKILAELIPTRILGDFLQGIFEFNEPTVDLTSAFEMDAQHMPERSFV